MLFPLLSQTTLSQRCDALAAARETAVHQAAQLSRRLAEQDGTRADVGLISCNLSAANEALRMAQTTTAAAVLQVSAKEELCAQAHARAASLAAALSSMQEEAESLRHQLFDALHSTEQSANTARRLQAQLTAANAAAAALAAAAVPAPAAMSAPDSAHPSNAVLELSHQLADWRVRYADLDKRNAALDRKYQALQVQADALRGRLAHSATTASAHEHDADSSLPGDAKGRLEALLRLLVQAQRGASAAASTAAMLAAQGSPARSGRTEGGTGGEGSGMSAEVLLRKLEKRTAEALLSKMVAEVSRVGARSREMTTAVWGVLLALSAVVYWPCLHYILLPTYLDALLLCMSSRAPRRCCASWGRGQQGRCCLSWWPRCAVLGAG